MIECPDCHFTAGPAEAASNGGTCPNCSRPYRDQPTPLNSEMSMRDMPEPGMEDSGGNPLQEGMLGDWQNREKRDESYASVKPQFEVTEVIVPDPDSIREDKEQMEKNADFLDTLGDIGKDVAPVAGGVAGFALGGPAGAALGAGLAGGGVSALEGNSVGQDLGTGALDAGLGLAGGMGAGALGLSSLPAAAGEAGDMAAGAGAASMGADAASAQGATSSGLGSLMKSAWGKVPTQQLQKAYMTHSLLNDAGNMTQPAQQSTMGQPAPALPSSYYSAVETPSSQGHIPSNDTSNPEEVDFHEKNDESHEDPLSQIGQSPGGTDMGPDDFFEADSPAFAQFATLLPKILDFALSDKSAAGDPDMESLHQALEAEKPGYMDSANDAHGEKIIVALLGGKGNEEQSDDLLQDNDAPHDPISEHEATALKPGLEQTCPTCGGVMDASTGHCPQCGSPNMMSQPQPTNPAFTTPQQMMDPAPAQNPAMPVVAAASQGPNDPQQQAAVAELLQQEGRDQEIPTMLTEPWNYGDELSKITGGEEPPDGIGQEGPPPPQTPPGQESQSPVPPMSAPPGGAGGSQMLSAISKYAATVDGVAEKCPNCGSHTTGYTDYENGNLGCKTCGHKWTGKKMTPTVQSATSLVHEAPVPAVPDTQGEEVQPSDNGERGNHSWIDASGTPLQVGQSYQLYSSTYSIPDPITIDAVKPDVIEYTTHGEYGMSHRTEMTHEEANVEKYSFIPSEAPEEVQPEAGEEHPGTAPVPGPGEVTDSSTPHEMQPMMSSVTADFNDTNPPGIDSAGGEPPMPPGMDNNVTQTDAGQANRIAQMLMKEGFPQAMAEAKAVELVRGLGTHEMRGVAEDIQAAPETQHPLGPSYGSTEEEPKEHGPDWLKEDDDPDDLAPRTAGAKMTPWEQRDYIDEMGDARNSDKMNLGGTHYEMNDLDESFLWG